MFRTTEKNQWVPFVRDNLQQIIYDALEQSKKLYASAFYRKYGARIVTMTTTAAASRSFEQLKHRPRLRVHRRKGTRKKMGIKKKRKDAASLSQGMRSTWLAGKRSHGRRAIIKNSRCGFRAKKSRAHSFSKKGEDAPKGKKKGLLSVSARDWLAERLEGAN